MTSFVVRIRPAAQTYAGRSLEQAMTVLRDVASVGTVSGFDVEFLLDVPLAFSELEDMAEVLAEDAHSEDLILIEASFATREVARSYQVLDSLISSLLSQVAILQASCQVAIFMQNLPNRVDQVHDLLGIGFLDGRLTILNEAGEHLGDSDLAARLVGAFAEHPAPEDNAERAILRHRGVFRGSNSGRGRDYMFYYEALPKTSSHFQGRFVEALARVRPDVIIFDTSSSGAWFISMVQGACVQLQTIHAATLTSIDVGQWVAYQDGALEEPQRSRVEAAAAVLAMPGSTVAVIVPAYASGRSLTRALEMIGSPDLSRCTAFALFADTGASLRESHLPGIHGMATQPYGGRMIDVHCMHQVVLRTIDRDDWLVAAAEVLGEVRALPVEQVDLGTLDQVALWSLYADCGVDVERVPAGGRAPKRYFPDLARLDHWDAHWLAEAVVANILTRVPKSNRAALLVVIPAEENGTQPISQALLEKCRIAVLAVPRDMIDGDTPVTDSVLEKLRLHTADTIAVLDESTVTHGTLEKLARLVETTIRIRPDLVGTVMDVSLTPPRLDIPFFSLAKWAALAEEPM